MNSLEQAIVNMASVSPIKPLGQLSGFLTKQVVDPNSGLQTAFKLSLGDYALIGVGIVMTLGALLIAQKETVIKIGDTAAKGAALVG